MRAQSKSKRKAATTLNERLSRWLYAIWERACGLPRRLWASICANPAGLCLLLIIPALVSTRAGWVALRKHERLKMAAEVGAVAEFWGPPKPNRANTRMFFSQRTEKGVGVFWCDLASGRTVLISEAPDASLVARLAPHEWIRTRTGQLLKTDHSGHDCDHTIIGKQSILWDIAGVIVEWNLDLGGASPLLCVVEQKGFAIEPNALAFYRMAYAAFRLGMTSLCAGQELDGSAEQLRLHQARNYYGRTLHALCQETVG
jgi:hypothetical protein